MIRIIAIKNASIPKDGDCAFFAGIVMYVSMRWYIKDACAAGGTKSASNKLGNGAKWQDPDYRAKWQSNKLGNNRSIDDIINDIIYDAVVAPRWQGMRRIVGEIGKISEIIQPSIMRNIYYCSQAIVTGGAEIFICGGDKNTVWYYYKLKPIVYILLDMTPIITENVPTTRNNILTVRFEIPSMFYPMSLDKQILFPDIFETF